jgi:hypothetical protein
MEMETAMRVQLQHLRPQPLVAVLISTLALLALVGSWMAPFTLFTTVPDLDIVVVGIFLGSCVVVAYHYPIHLHRHTKVFVHSVPLYLMAALLLPSVAALTAALSTLIGELLVRSKRGNLPSDIATATSRWSIVVLLGATIVHLPNTADGLHVPLLFTAAITMFLADSITAALEIAPICGEAPRRIIAMAVRQSGVIEGIQYLLGILGALTAIHYPGALLLLVLPIVLVYRAFKQVIEVQNSTLQLLESMADTVDLRDPYTGGHSRRVAELCSGILHELNIQGLEAELIIAAARIHDIGKIAIPDQILHKPGRLTGEELAVMQSHPERGATLLMRYPDFARGVEIVRHHHESWDGTGYPQGLKGHAIPFGARVIAVADSFDAMITDRPYRPGMSVQQAATILRAGRGQQWDSAIVEAFLRRMADQIEHPIMPPHLISTTQATPM